MANKVYADRLKEQYDILSNLMNDMTVASYDGTEEEMVIAGQTVTNHNICTIWNIAKRILVGRANDPDDGVLQRLADILQDALDDTDPDDIIKNCALRREIKRTIELIECLIKAIENTNCDPDCPEEVGRLYCLLLRLILLALAIIVKFIILFRFCKDCYSTCVPGGRLNKGFCECLIDELKEELDDVKDLIDDFTKLAFDFMKCSMHQCKYNDNEPQCGYKPGFKPECKPEWKPEWEQEWKPGCKPDHKPKCGC